MCKVTQKVFYIVLFTTDKGLCVRNFVGLQFKVYYVRVAQASQSSDVVLYGVFLMLFEITRTFVVGL